MNRLLKVSGAAILMGLPSLSHADVYIGVHGGYGFGSLKQKSNYQQAVSTTKETQGKGSIDPKGLQGGVHLGYEKMIQAWALGVEVNADGAAQKETQRVTLNTGPAVFHNSIKIQQRYSQDLMVKLGYQIQNYVPYAKVGASVNTYRIKAHSNDQASLHDTNTHKIRPGFKVAAGITLPLCENVSWGLEYTHTFIKGFKVSQDVPGEVQKVEHRFKPNMNTVMLRVNYKI